jgi:hypothetical protein
MRTLDPRQLASLYKPGAKTPVIVDVPPLRFLQIDGQGDIGGPTFQAAIGALFSLSYPVKFAAKKALGLNYKVAPLEGLYWHATDNVGFDPQDRASHSWRLMIMLPEDVPEELVEQTRQKVAAKKNPPRLADIRIQTFSEGRSVQILHVGPYAEETPTVERLFAFAEENGLEIVGKHHEIYLGDPNRAAADKLKTVLRYGVRAARG